MATEAVTASIRWLFDETEVDRTYAVVIPENAASRTVLARLGMVQERNVTGADNEKWARYDELPFYTLTRDAWLARAGSEGKP